MAAGPARRVVAMAGAVELPGNPVGGGSSGSWGMTIRVLVAGLGLLGAGACWLGLLAGDPSPAGRAALGTACLAVGLWGSELLPLPVTAILAMTLLFTSGAVPSVQAALVGFSSRDST